MDQNVLNALLQKYGIVLLKHVIVHSHLPNRKVVHVFVQMENLNFNKNVSNAPHQEHGKITLVFVQAQPVVGMESNVSVLKVFMELTAILNVQVKESGIALLNHVNARSLKHYGTETNVSVQVEDTDNFVLNVQHQE